MSEHEWQEYMALLAQENNVPQTHCVGCWHEERTEPFPALDSSGLCGTHAEATRQAYYGQQGSAQ